MTVKYMQWLTRTELYATRLSHIARAFIYLLLACNRLQLCMVPRIVCSPTKGPAGHEGRDQIGTASCRTVFWLVRYSPLTTAGHSAVQKCQVMWPAEWQWCARMWHFTRTWTLSKGCDCMITPDGRYRKCKTTQPQVILMWKGTTSWRISEAK